jgi:hypothetical protein
VPREPKTQRPREEILQRRRRLIRQRLPKENHRMSVRKCAKEKMIDIDSNTECSPKRLVP